MSHNRWHPDIPPAPTIEPGEALTLDAEDGIAGQVTREHARSLPDHRLGLAHRSLGLWRSSARGRRRARGQGFLSPRSPTSG